MQSNVPMVKLGEVLTERQEKPDLESVMMGEIPIIAKIRFNTGTIEYREGFDTKTNMILVKPGDLIISGINAEKGAIALYDENNSKNCAATIHYSSYSINRERADPKFLWFFFRSEMFRSILIHSLPNGIKTEVKPFRLLKLEIPLPPLKEQQHIVATLERLMAKREEARKERTRSTTETENLVNKKIDNIFTELKEKYGSQNLRGLLIQGGYGTSVKCDYHIFGNSIPILRIPNIISEKITFENLKYGILNDSEKNRCLINKGDILVVRTNGSADLVGRCAFVPKKDRKMGFASYLIRLECDQAQIFPEYLQTFLAYLRKKGSLFDFARTTAGQYNVSLKRLYNAEISVPPLPEQRRIVAHLDHLQAKVDEVKRLQVETESEMEALVPAVLAKAFSGKNV